MTMRVPDPNILVVRRPPPCREGRDLDHRVSVCSEGARACFGGGGGRVPSLLSHLPHFCWGGVGAAKGLLPRFLVPKWTQPRACTLALWWLKFGPTEGQGGGGGVGGSGTQKFVYQRWPDKIFPIVNFVSSHHGPFGLG